MSTSRTIRLTASFVVVAAALALTGAVPVTAAADAAHLGTDHLAQSPGRSAEEPDIGAINALRHEQMAQYLVDHALELSQNR